MRRTIPAVVLATLMVLSIGTATSLAQESPPPVPASYYGGIQFEGEADVPAGFTIRALVNGEVKDSITTGEGSYGGAGGYYEKLVVNCDAGECSGQNITYQLVDGDTVVGALDTNPAKVEWESGEVAQVDLTFPELPEQTPTDPGPPPAGGGDGGDGGAGGGGGGAPPAQAQTPTDTPEPTTTPIPTTTTEPEPGDQPTVTPLPTVTEIEEETGPPGPDITPPPAGPTLEPGGFSLTAIAGLGAFAAIVIAALILFRMKWL